MPEKSSVIVALRPPFADERGSIQNLVDAAFTSVAVIRCVKGAVRANHYHKTDYHYCWLASGEMDYYHRPAGSSQPPARERIHAGQLFYTPAMTEHTMHFLQESVFYAFSRNNRETENYEADIVRIPSLLDAVKAAGQ
jgi:hypothetical protein